MGQKITKADKKPSASTNDSYQQSTCNPRPKQRVGDSRESDLSEDHHQHLGRQSLLETGESVCEEQVPHNCTQSQTPIRLPADINTNRLVADLNYSSHVDKQHTLIHTGLSGSVSQASNVFTPQASTSDSDYHCPKDLSPHDLKTVYNCMFSARTKWCNIGLALNVLPDSLDEIRIKFRDDPSECLREVLCYRLRMSPGLTWADVSRALRKPAVKEGVIADSVDREYGRSGNKSAATDSILSEKPNLIDLCSLHMEKDWYALGLWLKIKDENLEVIKCEQKQHVSEDSPGAGSSEQLKPDKQVPMMSTTSDSERVVDADQHHQDVAVNPNISICARQKVFSESDDEDSDLKNDNANQQSPEYNRKCMVAMFEKFISKSDTPSYEKVVKALLKIGREDVAEDLCKRLGVSLKDVSLKGVLRKDDLPECVADYAEYLKNVYTQMSILPDPDWPPSILDTSQGETFTHLALIQRDMGDIIPNAKDASTMAHDYAHGKIDNITSRKRDIHFSETFLPIVTPDFERSRLTILMDGAPGVGKTTLARKVCVDWANGVLLQDYRLVIFVPLREIKETGVQDLSELLPADNYKLRAQIVEHIQDTSGEQVLFIFDGFDELSPQTRSLSGRSLISDIIKGSKLHHCSVLVTSRPYASGALRTLKRVNRHIEVLGFTKKQIRDCIKQNMPQPRAKQLIRKLQERLDIASLCYIPLNCKILIFVYKQQEYSMPSTLTQLYEIFVLHGLIHHVSKSETDPNVLEEMHEAVDLTSLPQSVQEQLDSLSAMAYKGLVEDKLVFGKEEINCPESALLLGLMSSVHTFTKLGLTRKQYQFLHLTIQEFLAARHIASDKLSCSEKAAFFRSRITDVRFRLALLFLSGLTHLSFLSPKEPLVEKKIDLSVRHHSNTENQADFLFLAHLQYESGDSSSESLLRSLESLDIFSMYKYQLSRFDCLFLSQFLSTACHVWRIIDLKDSKLTDQSLEMLSKGSSEAVPLKMCQTLSLGRASESWPETKNVITANGISHFLLHSNSLVEVFLPKCTDLNLEQDYTKQCGGIMEIITKLLSQETLQRISFGRDIVISKGSLVVKNLIGCSVRFCTFTFQKVLAFLDPEAFYELHLVDHPEAFQSCSNCGIPGEESTNTLCNLIDASATLQDFTVSNCQLPDEKVASILLVLTRNCCKYIDVDGNNPGKFTHQAVASLLMSLPVNTTLHIYGLCVESVVDFNPHREVLSVRGHSATGAINLFQCLESNTRIAGLHVRIETFEHFRQPTRSVGVAFLQLLQTNHTIEVVSISKGFSICVAEELGGAITASNSLHVLDLNSCRVLAVPTLTAVGKSNSLTSLDLSFSNTFKCVAAGQSTHAKKVEKALTAMLQSAKSLKSLNLSHCDLHDALAKRIAVGLLRNNVLKEFSMSANESITSEGWIPLFQALQQNLSLLKLDISLNCLGDLGSEALSEMLYRNRTLIVLEAQQCGLTDRGVEAMAANIFSQRFSLRELNIRDNWAITTFGLLLLFESLRLNSSINKLNVSRDVLGASQTIDVTVGLAEMLSKNKGIHELNIRGYSLSDSALKVLAQALVQNSSLQTLQVYYDQKIGLESAIEQLKRQGRIHSSNFNLKIIEWR